MREMLRRIRVLIADDHAMVRTGLIRVLECQADMHVVGEAADGEIAIRRVVELKPDVLLLDVAMPSMSGIEALKYLAELDIQTKVILLTAAIEKNRIIESVQLGARGVILKESSSELLCKCIRGVASGQYWLDNIRACDIADALAQLMRMSQTPRQNQFGLTSRELQIVAAVLSGDGNKQIAHRLQISNQTVKNHLTAIFSKIGVSSRLELALFATRDSDLERELRGIKRSPDTWPHDGRRSLLNIAGAGPIGLED